MFCTTIGLINRTPLIHLKRVYKGIGKIYAKAEYMQPGGSVKDRAALQIIKDAYEDKQLNESQVVVEMTSGNMGAGLAVVCRQYGNPFIAVMPEGNSPERLKILRALGAEIVLTKQVDGKPGMVTGNDIAFASDVARELAKEKNGFYVDQFNNPSSVRAHLLNTGPEIYNELQNTNVFIAAVGSGGTFIGTSRYLKSQNESIRCMAVEPEHAAILKTGRVDNPKHIIQGIGYGLIPPHWDKQLADDIITVSDDEVRYMTKKLALEQGLYVGYSSGANVTAAIKFLERENSDLNVVTILCDTAYKYSDL